MALGGCRCVKHVKSNAITVAKGQRLLGMGSGQPNRVKSTQIALEKAGEEAKVRLHPPALSSAASCPACPPSLPPFLFPRCLPELPRGPLCLCVALRALSCAPCCVSHGCVVTLLIS